MMLDMIACKGNGAGKYLRQVAQDSRQRIVAFLFKQQVMRTFVDHHKQGMIGKGANKISNGKNGPPAAVTEQPGQCNLEAYDKQDKENGGWIFTDQVPDFGLFFQNTARADTMRFAFIRKEEVGTFHGKVIL